MLNRFLKLCYIWKYVKEFNQGKSYHPVFLGKFLSLLEDKKKKKFSLQYKHHLFTILFIDSLINPVLNGLQ